MNITQLYRDYGIYTAVPGDKHYRDGWVNTPCPFCTGNPGNHLGFNLYGNYFYCWRCGGKSRTQAISELTSTDLNTAIELIKHYGGEGDPDLIPREKKEKSNFQLPSMCGSLEPRHKKYLKRRGFDPDYLEEEWDLKGTGPVSKLGDAKYNHRIIAPIYWDNQIVSFQGRDITDHNPPKYKACPQEREIKKHQTIIYRHPYAVGRIGIATEGIADVWNIGREAFGTFGIDYTISQITAICTHYDTVAVWFDPEVQAQFRAKRLMKTLKAKGVKAFNYKTTTDPGEANRNDINKILEKLLT